MPATRGTVLLREVILNSREMLAGLTQIEAWYPIA